MSEGKFDIEVSIFLSFLHSLNGISCFGTVLLRYCNIISTRISKVN